MNTLDSNAQTVLLFLLLISAVVFVAVSFFVLFNQDIFKSNTNSNDSQNNWNINPFSGNETVPNNGSGNTSDSSNSDYLFCGDKICNGSETSLSCPGDCKSICGDKKITHSEQCEGTNLNGNTCLSLGFDYGTLKCSPSYCVFDVSGCRKIACGNNIIEQNEFCDGTSLQEKTCLDFGFDTGKLKCLSNCSNFDTSKCGKIVCGDGLIEGVEACDDEDTSNGDGCNSVCGIENGWSCSGEPSVCLEDCGNGVCSSGEDSFNCPVDCGYPPFCGDGNVDSGEECDDGRNDTGDGCDSNCGIENGWSCSGEPSSCFVVCGDGLVTPPEVCDTFGNIGCSGMFRCNVSCSACYIPDVNGGGV